MFRLKKGTVQKAAASAMAVVMLLSGINVFATAAPTSTPPSNSTSTPTSESTPNNTPDVLGSPYITAYTVTDAVGN